VLECFEEEKLDTNEIIIKTLELMRKYSCDHCYLDGSSPSLIDSIASALGEEIPVQDVIKRYEKNKIDPANNMKMVPVNFGTKHKDLLAFSKIVLERGLVAINENTSLKFVGFLRNARESSGKLLETHSFAFFAETLSFASITSALKRLPLSTYSP
jgi:hypothetical protein